MRTSSLVDSLTTLLGAGIRVSAVVDIGVHVATPALMQVFPGCKHYLFEPVRAHLEGIERNYAKIRHKVYLLAVSSEDGDCYLVSVSKMRGVTEVSHSYISEKPVNVEQVSNVVECAKIQKVKLDTIVSAEIEETDYLLKVDVDGHELEVLKGAEEALKKASIVVMEATFDRREEPTFLQRSAYMQEKDFYLMDVTELCYYEHVLWQADLVFVRKDIVESLDTLRPFQGEGFKFDPAKWYRG